MRLYKIIDQRAPAILVFPYQIYADALLDCVNNLASYSQYYVNTASMHNLTSCDNTRSLRKIVFCEFASIAMSRV